MSARAELLIKQITLNSSATESGARANELLGEFFLGFPLRRLLPLLFSQDDEVAKLGAFIASELGRDAAPILDDMVALLDHPVRAVRFGAIDVVLTCATPENGRHIAAVIAMLNDTDASVRWKALDFLSRASCEQLYAALRHLERTAPGSRHVFGLRWLLSDSAREPSESVSWIHADEPLLRKYGVVDAVRNGARNRQPLKDAASCDDSDVSAFAADALTLEKEKEKGKGDITQL